MKGGREREREDNRAGGRACLPGDRLRKWAYRRSGRLIKWRFVCSAQSIRMMDHHRFGFGIETGKRELFRQNKLYPAGGRRRAANRTASRVTAARDLTRLVESFPHLAAERARGARLNGRNALGTRRFARAAPAPRWLKKPALIRRGPHATVRQ